MDTFTAIADPTRRNILEMLATKGELPASDIYNEFQVSPPAISQHLKVLRKANLVQVEKRAQYRVYRINPQSVNEIEEWITKLKKTWDERYDRLDKLLAEEKKKLGKAKRK